MPPNFQTGALYAMDNLDVMRGMDSETIDLIYLDPPFNSKRMYQGMSGTKAAAHRFRDTWSWNDAKQEWLDQLENDYPDLHRLVYIGKAHSGGMGGYLGFMAPRVIEMHRIIKPTGTLYLHCDPHANAYLRVLMDNVFGEKNFRNEIVWCYSGGGIPKKDFPRKHDTIFRYAKSNDWKFAIERKPYKENTQQVGIHSTYSGESNKIDLARGTPITDWWTDIPTVTGWNPENSGWNTQKPLALLERIIKASSTPNDIVFDPFCGCGTAMVAAENLGRRWVGSDHDANSIDVVHERLASLKGIVTDSPQLQLAVSVLRQPPARTETVDQNGVLKDPTGYTIPKLPSDKMSNAAIRAKLLEWQADSLGYIICPGCLEQLKARHFHVDHIDPKTQGGSNRIDNRILLCGACNLEKGANKTLNALWIEHRITGKKRKEIQDRVKTIRERARAHIREIDAGQEQALQSPPR